MRKALYQYRCKFSDHAPMVLGRGRERGRGTIRIDAGEVRHIFFLVAYSQSIFLFVIKKNNWINVASTALRTDLVDIYVSRMHLSPAIAAECNSSSEDGWKYMTNTSRRSDSSLALPQSLSALWRRWLLKMTPLLNWLWLPSRTNVSSLIFETILSTEFRLSQLKKTRSVLAIFYVSVMRNWGNGQTVKYKNLRISG